MDSITPETAEERETAPEGIAARKGIAARLMEISRETAPLMSDGRTFKQLMDELYDEETGLPK
ncbi:MAG TPA: hypothetical protein VGG56_14925 [Terracidiphilus sp.]|jgi:hypothetical protein